MLEPRLVIGSAAVRALLHEKRDPNALDVVRRVRAPIRRV